MICSESAPWIPTRLLRGLFFKVGPVYVINRWQWFWSSNSRFYNYSMIVDPFHAVKKKRDRKKENLSVKAQSDSQLKVQNNKRYYGNGRGAYSSRYISHDFGAKTNHISGKENGFTLFPSKEIISASSSESLETADKVDDSQSRYIPVSNRSSYVVGSLPVTVGSETDAFSESSRYENEAKVPLNSQPSNSHLGSSRVRISSKYESRPRFYVPRKATSKEWKPKPAVHNPADILKKNSESNVSSPEEKISQLQLMFGDLYLSDGIVIPNPQQISDVKSDFLNGTFSTLLRETSTNDQESVKPSNLGTQNICSTENEEGISHKTELKSRTSGIEICQKSAVAEFKPQQDGTQPVVQPSPVFGLIPNPNTSQFPQFESSEILAPDSFSSGFTIQQPLDSSTGYYAQVYQAASDLNSCLPQFHAASKHNGNGCQEIPSNDPQAQALAATSSLPLTQQPIHHFQPLTTHNIPDYPPNYYSYPIFTPFYVIPQLITSPSLLPQPLPSSCPKTGFEGIDNLAGPHFGDAAFYVHGPQSETLGQDLAGTFYSFPPQPEVISLPNGVYQLPQASQLDW
ncbi:uncharacterized protein LOC144703621 isoform X3 [Wolffia australiana]